MKKYSKSEIENMDYSTFVGMLDERNRPSGGIRTVQTALINARIDASKKVLEVGSNTGFTCVNIELLSGAEVIGIDTNQESIEKARNYAAEMGTKKTTFIVGNALNLPFEDESFDMVWCSNVTSFIDNKQDAIKEYLRVLKSGGTLAIAPIYYVSTPPENLISSVSEAIGCRVGVMDKQDWIGLLKDISHSVGSALEIYFDKDFRYLNQAQRINEYIQMLINKMPGRDAYGDEELEAIKQRGLYFYRLFNENNYKYAGFSLVLMQKRSTPDEEELFLTEEA